MIIERKDQTAFLLKALDPCGSEMFRDHKQNLCIEQGDERCVCLKKLAFNMVVNVKIGGSTFEKQEKILSDKLNKAQMDRDGNYQIFKKGPNQMILLSPNALKESEDETLEDAYSLFLTIDRLSKKTIALDGKLLDKVGKIKKAYLHDLLRIHSAMIRCEGNKKEINKLNQEMKELVPILLDNGLADVDLVAVDAIVFGFSKHPKIQELLTGKFSLD